MNNISYSLCAPYDFIPSSESLTILPQDNEGILPVVHSFICSPQIYVSQRRRARGGKFVIGFININKYTSAFENVHLCPSQNRQLGHISVATGRIPSLFCTIMS